MEVQSPRFSAIQGLVDHLGALPAKREQLYLILVLVQWAQQGLSDTVLPQMNWPSPHGPSRRGLLAHVLVQLVWRPCKYFQGDQHCSNAKAAREAEEVGVEELKEYVGLPVMRSIENDKLLTGTSDSGLEG